MRTCSSRPGAMQDAWRNKHWPRTAQAGSEAVVRTGSPARAHRKNRRRRRDEAHRVRAETELNARVQLIMQRLFRQRR